MKIKLLDKKLDNSLSASQVETYSRCAVRWAWEKLNGEPRPESGAAANLGTDVHTVLEAYLKEGKKIDILTDIGRIAYPGLIHLPKPEIEHVEKYFTIAVDDVPYVGFIDFVYEKDGIWIVGDHKTTSDFRYVKKVEELQSNIQAMLYANYAFEWLKVDRVRLNWVYYKTRGPAQARLVSIDVDKEQGQAEMVRINEIGKEMFALRNSCSKAEDLEPNVDACMDFGGCPFIDLCKKKHPTWRKKMSEKLTLKEKLKLGKEPKEIKEVKEVKEVKEEVIQLGNRVKNEGFTLCVDCFPVKVDAVVIHFTDYVLPILKRISDDSGVPHYKLMKYGEGSGLLAAELEVELKNNPPAAGSYIYLDTMGHVGKDCLDALKAAAKNIIEGV